MSDHRSDGRPRSELSRRDMLRLTIGGGVTASLAGCLIDDKEPGGDGWIPKQYDAPGNWPIQVRGRVPLDPANPSVARDDRKCILCGQCTEVCQRTQTVLGNYSLPVKDDFVCVHCGQCAMWCPTGAITEVDDVARVQRALSDPSKIVVVQTAPATRVGIGEEFGLAPGTWAEGQQVAALRKLGFKKVFDTNFTADLTIMEEGSELVHRLTAKPALPIPQLTSCCPGWVKFVEYFYPELIPNLSSAKSPQQMMGAVIKTYWAKQHNVSPGDIFSVSIMPCTAKKFECQRPEFESSGLHWKKPGVRDVDAVLTVRELARMVKTAGIDLAKLPEERYDTALGEGSGAAILFGATGGVMEGAVRSAYFLVTGKKAPPAAFALAPVRGLAGVKEASLEIPGFGPLSVAVAHGLGNARRLLDSVGSGANHHAFIEVMACPGGCITGGGMPRAAVPPSDEVRQRRTHSLLAKDASYALRESHNNTEVRAIYAQFLERPLSHRSHELLHTHYQSRSGALTAKKKSDL